MRIGIAAISVCLTLWAAAPATATPTRIEFSGRLGFVNPAGNVDPSVQSGQAFTGSFEADLDGVTPEPPNSPIPIPNQASYRVPISGFTLSTGNLTLAFAGTGTTTILDDEISTASDEVLVAIEGLLSTPALGTGGDLFLLIGFADDTQTIHASTDFLFPTSDAPWSSIGFTLFEYVPPGRTLQSKFFGSITSWQVVPEPGSAALLAFGLAWLGCFPLERRRRIS
ncbi:MAG: hypothetical protein AAF430_07100 [Myxococcota bacterium]